MAKSYADQTDLSRGKVTFQVGDARGNDLGGNWDQKYGEDVRVAVIRACLDAEHHVTEREGRTLTYRQAQAALRAGELVNVPAMSEPPSHTHIGHWVGAERRMRALTSAANAADRETVKEHADRVAHFALGIAERLIAIEAARDKDADTGRLESCVRMVERLAKTDPGKPRKRSTKSEDGAEKIGNVDIASRIAERSEDREDTAPNDEHSAGNGNAANNAPHVGATETVDGDRNSGESDLHIGHASMAGEQRSELELTQLGD